MLKFKCRTCGGTELEEIMINVIQTSVIDTIKEDGNIDYDFDRICADEGEICHYQCSNCGSFIKENTGNIINDPEELVKWIKENCPQDNGYVDPRYLDDNADM